jgi:hypothetical protein
MATIAASSLRAGLGDPPGAIPCSAGPPALERPPERASREGREYRTEQSE